MKTTKSFVSFVLVMVLTFLTGCAPAVTSVPPTSTNPPLPEPTATATEIALPSPTPLPGAEVIPIETFGKNIPWLSMENTARPGVVYFLFNLSKPPFDNVLVRQAFAAALDRDALARVAQDHGVTDARPATTFTPPETLGRDLYNEVGISFYPANARKLFQQAGYTDVTQFPPVTLITNPGADGRNTAIAEEMVRMWQIYLGVNVTLEVVSAKYFDRAQTNPTEIFFSIWAADYNDPDGFLQENFQSAAQYNYNHFNNTEFDQLMALAAASNDPAERQALYIQAERLLCEVETAVIPIYHTTFNIP